MRSAGVVKVQDVRARVGVEEVRVDRDEVAGGGRRYHVAVGGGMIAYNAALGAATTEEGPVC